MYRVKAFDVMQAIDETFEDKDLANDLYYQYVDKSCPAYLYQGETLINSYDPAYDEYCERVTFSTSCVYCGGHAGGGYCYQSPDGNHVMND